MTKTYLVAADAPLEDHLKMLVRGLKDWEKECIRLIARSRTPTKDSHYWRGKRDAFREAIQVIEQTYFRDTPEQKAD